MRVEWSRSNMGIRSPMMYDHHASTPCSKDRLSVRRALIPASYLFYYHASRFGKHEPTYNLIFIPVILIGCRTVPSIPPQTTICPNKLHSRSYFQHLQSTLKN